MVKIPYDILTPGLIFQGFKIPYDTGHVKPKIIKLVIAAYPQSTDWVRIRIMCSSGLTCLPAHCCFSELAL